MKRGTEPLRLKRVLCATDFLGNAKAALEAALTIARPWKAEIRVVHVSPPSRPAGGAPCPPGPGIDEASRADLVQRLDQFAQPAIAAGLETLGVLRQGDPCAEIVREAKRAAVDVIVMGRHELGSRERWFLGSVTECVLRQAPCPVMVVRRRARPAGEGRPHVLCALDLGETSRATLECAAALTSALEADLVVLHVVTSSSSGPPATNAPAGGERPGGAVRDARLRLAALVANASLPAYPSQQRVVAGTPDREILEAAGGSRIDLLVIGSHAGRVTDRQFLGSTTLHLLRRSECPVLVVPARVTLANALAAKPPSVLRTPEAREAGYPRAVRRR